MAYLSDRVDVNVVFGVGGMRYEWLDKEMSQNTLYSLDLLSLASAGLYPSTSFRPRLVQGQKTALSSTLDQLIGFGDEFSTVLQ